MRVLSTPKPCPAARASPDSFSSTRLKARLSLIFLDLLRRSCCRGLVGATLLADGARPTLIADFEASEAANRNVLAQLSDLAGDQLRDGDGLFLDEGLLV